MPTARRSPERDLTAVAIQRGGQSYVFLIEDAAFDELIPQLLQMEDDPELDWTPEDSATVFDLAYASLPTD